MEKKKQYTVKDLIEKLKEFPENCPVKYAIYDEGHADYFDLSIEVIGIKEPQIQGYAGGSNPIYKYKGDGDGQGTPAISLNGYGWDQLKAGMGRRIEEYYELRKCETCKHALILNAETICKNTARINQIVPKDFRCCCWERYKTSTP